MTCTTKEWSLRSTIVRLTPSQAIEPLGTMSASKCLFAFNLNSPVAPDPLQPPDAPHPIHMTGDDMPSQGIAHSQRALEVQALSDLFLPNTASFKCFAENIEAQNGPAELDERQANALHGNALALNKRRIPVCQPEDSTGPIHRISPARATCLSFAPIL